MPSSDVRGGRGLDIFIHKSAAIDLYSWLATFADFSLKGAFQSVENQQSGAAGACWAHNPKVGGSKPPSAITVFSFLGSVSFGAILS